jgi:hypothetical protein
VLDRKEKDTAEKHIGLPNITNHHVVSMTVYKNNFTNVFTVSKNAKAELESILRKNQYKDI